MTKSILLIVVSILIFGFTAQAQDNEDSPQIDLLTDRLKRYAGDLVSNSYGEIKDDSSNNRKEIERAFLAQQFDASVGLFQQMLGDERKTSDLRDAFEVLKDSVDRVPKNNLNETLLSNVKNTVKDIEREIKNRSDKFVKKDTTENAATDVNISIAGRAFWRGMVDNKVHLIIKGNKIAISTIEGQSLPDGTFTFLSILPSKEVTVGVKKEEGRGKVSVFQQPNSQNNFTAIVEIEDTGGGSKEYQLEIFWK